MVLLHLLACQEPFGTDRHDLVGFRIAAVRARPVRDGGPLSPRAAIVVEGRLWSETPADLSWYLVSDPAEVETLDPLSVADGFGPTPDLVLRGDRRVLALVARHDGEERRAFVELATPPATLSEPEAILADPPWTAPGGTLRLRATFPGNEDPIVRWMSTAGSFLEVDRGSTDWVAADGLSIDEGALQGDEVPLPNGPVSVLALALGAAGEVTFRATEVLVGEPPEGLWVQGRFVPGEGLPTVPAGQALRTTLREDTSSPVGFSIRGGKVVDPGGVEDWGTIGLPCLFGHDGPLDPAWWLEQHCFTRGLDDLPVVLVPDPSP